MRKYYVLIFVSLVSMLANATSLTLNVSSGQLKDMLLDSDVEPDELVLTGVLNSQDLKYINEGVGKISNVKTLDLSKITLDYDGGVYASGKDKWTDDGAGTISSVSFLLSDTPKEEYKYDSDALGRVYKFHYIYSNNLSGLFIDNSVLKKVILPVWMTSMGSYIFASSSVEEVVLPEAITAIPDYAFTFAEIKKVNTDKITSVGASAFRGSAMDAFDFSKIRTLGYRAFKDAASLSGKVELKGVNEVPDECFQSTAITEVVIGDGIKRIGEYAFYKITTLKNARLAEGVEYIDAGAFYDCNAIVSFNVPSTVKELGNNALPAKWVAAIPSEGNVVYIGNMAYQFRRDDKNLTRVAFKEGTTTISACFMERERYITEVFIPSSVYAIGEKAFDSCTKLEKVEFAKNSKLTVLRDGVFDYCIAMSSINLPETIASIGDKCFSYCKVLTEIALPSNLSYVGDNAFSSSSIKIKNIPTTLTHVGSDTFLGCVLPGSIVLGKDLTYIGAGAFAECTGVYNVRIECDSLKKAEKVFRDSGIERVTIAKNVTNLPSLMFNESKTLTKITFEDSETAEPYLKIGSKCFYKCSSLKVPEIPGQLAEIGNSAFTECTLPDTLSTKNIQIIHDHAFDYCKGVRHVDITNKLRGASSDVFGFVTSIKSVRYNAPDLKPAVKEEYTMTFPNTSQIESVVIGRDVEVIPGSLFSGAQTLNSVVFEERENNLPLKIKGYAFNDTWNLTEIWLPDGVTEIGEYTFYNSMLNYIHLGKGLKSIGNSAFEKTALSGYIDLPETVELIGSKAIPNNVYGLYCHSEKAPEFKGNVPSNIIFYAPQDYIENYKRSFPDNTVLPYTGCDFSLSGGQVEVGKTYYLFPAFDRDEFASLNLTWESSDESVIKTCDSYDRCIFEVVGEGKATVTARYLHHDGKAQTCTLYTEGFSSVDEIVADEFNSISVRCDGSDILISGLSENSNVSIFNIYGIRVFSGNADDGGRLVLPAQSHGIYIVRAGAHNAKIKI